MINNYEQLEALLLDKDFEALSPKEQTWVRQIMSEQEYQAERQVLLESKLLFEEKPLLPASNLSALQAQFKTKHASSPLRTPIAAYQALLLAALVGIIVWYLRPTEIQVQIQTKTDIVYQTKTDTLYQEKIIYQDRIVYKTKTIKLPIHKTDTVYMPFANRELFYQEKEKDPILAKQEGTGKSMKDMGALMNFVTN